MIERSAQQLLEQLKVPALPFIPEEKKERPQRQSKKERKEERDEFLKQSEELQPQEEYIEPEIIQTDYKEYEGTKILVWMDERIEEGRNWLQAVRSPKFPSDPYKASELKEEIEDFMTSGIYILSEEIIHSIESLIFFAKMNKDIFGSGNYLLNDIVVEIFGYEQIRDKIKTSKDKEVLTWFSRLLNCAARPIQVHEELVKQVIYQPSIGDTGLTNSLERG